MFFNGRCEYEDNAHLVFSQDGDQRFPKWTTAYMTFSGEMHRKECLFQYGGTYTIQNYYGNYGFVGGVGFPSG